MCDAARSVASRRPPGSCPTWSAVPLLAVVVELRDRVLLMFAACKRGSRRRIRPLEQLYIQTDVAHARQTMVEWYHVRLAVIAQQGLPEEKHSRVTLLDRRMRT